jgi:hypothetical protein
MSAAPVSGRAWTRVRSGAGALMLAGSIALALPAAGLGHGRPRLIASPPNQGRVGEVTHVSGRVQDAPRGTRVALEKHLADGHWAVVAIAPLHGGHFSIDWQPKIAGFSTLRLALRLHGHDFAISQTADALVGQANVYCSQAPAPTSLPAGEGWITGGLYIAGGPAPGIFACEAGTHTVSVSDQAGAVVATEQVTGPASYTFILPAGQYKLSEAGAGYCRSEGSVTVTAGAQTKADTICSVP